MDLRRLEKWIYIIIGIIAIIVSIPRILEPPDKLNQTAKIVSESETGGNESRNDSQDYKSQPDESEENLHWGNPSTLQDHFDRHGADFEAESPEDYALLANEFYNGREDYRVKIDEKGVARVYDPETNTFGAYNKNGTTRSFYKPSGGEGYFDRQPGKELG